MTFDLDGVHFIRGKYNFIRRLEALGVSEKDVNRVFVHSDQMNNQYKVGKLSDDEYWTWALGEWSLDLTVEEIVKILIEGYELNHRVADIVKRVRGLGYKTLICSNNFPARIKYLDEKFKFLKDFDVVTLSYNVGATKPSELIFQDLVDHSGVSANEIIFSDDDSEKLFGAKVLGIQTFTYDGVEGFIRSLRKFGVQV